MTPGDWERFLNALAHSPDRGVAKAGRLLARAFRTPALRPPADIFDQRDAIYAAVRTYYPTPFAAGFERWRETTQRFSETLQGGDAEATSDSFAAAFDRLYDLWKRAINFLSFLLMISVNRQRPDVVHQHAGDKLATAIALYRSFYEAADDRQRESDQRELVATLLALFRRLDERGVLGKELIFHPILRDAGGFAGLFPPRFEAHLLVIQQMRNRVEHNDLGKRPPGVLEPLYFFLQASFLDVVSTLRPIFAQYYLVFFTEVRPAATGDTGVGLVFSGVGLPAGAEFLLPPPGGDAEKIQPGQLYLVRRGREKPATGPADLLDPGDFLDLTPFLIYERQRLTAMLKARAPDSADSRLLFVFRNYLEDANLLSYREFAGREELAIEKSTREFENLVDSIQMFSRLLERFREGIVDSGSAADRVFDKTWRISVDHLGTVTNAAQYDLRGTRSADDATASAKRAFSEALFVAPAEASQIAGFLLSDKRGIVITGESGIGKSNLLCHFFLEERRAGRPAVFVAGRNLPGPDLYKFLEEEVARRIDRSWKMRELDTFSEQRGQPFTVFLDAVNEYSGPGGPPKLLKELIQFVEDLPPTTHVRLAFTCRDEVWDQYRTPRGKEEEPPPLPPAFFMPEAIRLGGFDDEERREALFSAYQQFYALRPQRSRQLSASVQSLIRHPFMMLLVAETYSNRGAGQTDAAAKKDIPKDLDYFKIFTELTARKFRDARWLDGSRGDILPGQMDACLFAFARLLLQRLTGGGTGRRPVPPAGRPADAAEKLGDALQWDDLQRDPKVGPFFNEDPGEGHISAFQAAVQVGLLQKQFVPEVLRSGVTQIGRVFRFFHDQYSQFWIAAVYNEETLGPIEGRTLAGPQLAAVAQAITELIHRSAVAPLLAGAVDHWLHRNMTLPPKGGRDLQIPLLNLLGESESGAVRHYVRSFLVSLLERNIVAPDLLYHHLFREGNRALCLGMAEAFDVMEAGADLPPELFRQFLDSCSDEHAGAVIERLADIFAQRFSVSPRETLQYLDRALDSLAGLPAAKAVTRLRSLVRRQLPFLLRFSYFAVVGSSGRAYAVGRLVGFARRKYRLLLNAIVRSRELSIRRRGFTGGVVRLLYGPLEAHGTDLWRRFGTAMSLSGNDRLFVANDGVVQRDVVYEFFPYAVALHNGDAAAASLAPGSPFRRLITRMLSFRVTSVIGYFAVVALPALLIQQWAAVGGIIDDLIAINTPSCRYFGPLLLVNVSYADQAHSERCLGLLREKILPWFQSHDDELDWLVLHGFGIAATDVPALWPSCAEIVESVFQHLERGQDEPKIARFGDELVKANFFDPELGERLLVMMLDRGSLDNPLWRTCTLKVMAGLLARSPAMLERMLKDRGMDESVEREARRFVTETLIQTRDVHIAQVTQNRFLVRAVVSDARLRYLIVKILVGGLAQSNSVEDFVKEIRRFTVELVAAYLGDRNDDRKYRTLSVGEALAEAQPWRIVDGGGHPEDRPGG